jgi:hypothetical protein
MPGGDDQHSRHKQQVPRNNVIISIQHMLRYTSAHARQCDVRRVKEEEDLNCTIVNWHTRAGHHLPARVNITYLINVTLATPVFPLFPAGAHWLKNLQIWGLWLGHESSRQFVFSS